MLVLTRRPSDCILFPKLGISIQIVRVDGRSVRLGIDAPRDVHVIRHELADGKDFEPRAQPPAPALDHAARNRLQTPLVSLDLLQRLMELGQLEPHEIENQLCEVIGQLEAIEAEPNVGRPCAAPPKLSSPWRPRRKALLVEDNANERTLLAGYLQTHDYDVATANDGADALDYLATHDKPDVVLLDMNMPRIGGAATVHVIRNNPQLAGVKLVAVSGLAPPDFNVPLGKDGVDQWFTKPIRPDLLVEELDRELLASDPPA